MEYRVTSLTRRGPGLVGLLSVASRHIIKLRYGPASRAPDVLRAFGTIPRLSRGTCAAAPPHGLTAWAAIGCRRGVFEESPVGETCRAGYGIRAPLRPKSGRVMGRASVKRVIHVHCVLGYCRAPEHKHR